MSNLFAEASTLWQFSHIPFISKFAKLPPTSLWRDLKKFRAWFLGYEEICGKYEEICGKYEERCGKYEERCGKYEEICGKFMKKYVVIMKVSFIFLNFSFIFLHNAFILFLHNYFHISSYSWDLEKFQASSPLEYSLLAKHRRSELQGVTLLTVSSVQAPGLGKILTFLSL